MNALVSRSAPQPALVDELLMDIAVRIQLSPTLQGLAIDRANTIAQWLQREGSPLQGRLLRLYPQGSMAIGATIRSKEDDDLFDIDLIAEVDWSAGTTAMQMLLMLYRAIKGEPGSKYYADGIVELQTRCVTIHYAEMHLDITPMSRNPAWCERGGYIAHAKYGAPVTDHRFVPANPWGFAEDFKEKTPAEAWFAEVILRKSYGRAIRADVEPVPEHEALYRKAMAVVALQLIKRHIYLLYARKPKGTRRPPSVYVAESIARNANCTRALIDELRHQVRCLQDSLKEAAQRGALIDVRNPALWEDQLTDRWPREPLAQRIFIGELEALLRALNDAKDETDLPKLKSKLALLFGENAAIEAVDAFLKRAGAETRQGVSRFAPATATALAGVSARSPDVQSAPVRTHRFYGD
ncbi:MAG: nucleotidyltransferase [Hyphomonadaceae bacterium]